MKKEHYKSREKHLQFTYCTTEPITIYNIKHYIMQSTLYIFVCVGGGVSEDIDFAFNHVIISLIAFMN